MDRVYGTDTSVHTGCFTADYMMVMGKDPELTPKFFATGVAAAMLSNRISSFYNLRGPSATVDTACSSSLVALDQACQSLRLGQSSMVRILPWRLSMGYYSNILGLGYCGRMQPHLLIRLDHWSV